MPPPLTAAPPTAGPDDLAFAELAVTAVVPLAVAFEQRLWVNVL